ncbi:MAG: glycolate oxidase subunit GlcF [Alphaproteobacteria bacterium]|nr:glycolate oxidase subunit GlcF [Alphaproteobacteria bacterium]MBU0795904.1 glycolate oxidase subunit GlcF [Alphaproteobacteria bacterium]MBU0886941.1 glycolate oxidase subunit GlcF [Alphaproteobacteria bacterium]MBU1813203.1 glycolate oxidase subunit GlcF [Alphaproteobacteria bacterium]MBU2090727.1 glycolate oxidase subunit GlcF [Alphaproteobacteria bacterium]
MQTNFSLAQLADPDIAVANDILRSCVHCGFCTATCPTYVLLGDELDSPRGRIYLIKDMLEGDRPATEQVTKHIDRCLSCLSCMTTCPSGVHYMHLVDHARTHIERTYKRPFMDRLMRNLLAAILPHPGRFRLALLGALLAKPFAGLLPARLRAMVKLAPTAPLGRSHTDAPQSFPALGERRLRVALLNGCAQPVLAPGINESTIRLLTRHGCEVVLAKGAGCCGALTHHMGKEDAAHASAKATIAAWMCEIEGDGLDAIVINASGCGTTVKDYGFMFREDAEWAGKAAQISALAKDVTEVMATLGLSAPVTETGLDVAYHSACSMQHGQKIRTEPRALLQAAGFTVKEVPEGHLCCGSAGTYNMLQPELATRLRDRKVANIEAMQPSLIATGNLGCMTQIGSGTGIPIVHTVELLDWATGGPKPAALERRI